MEYVEPRKLLGACLRINVLNVIRLNQVHRTLLVPYKCSIFLNMVRIWWISSIKLKCGTDS